MMLGPRGKLTTFRPASSSGGGGGFSPVTSVTSATCEWWLEASTGIVLVGSDVDTWADSSGIGDAGRNLTKMEPNFTPGGAANRPSYNASDAAYNNKPTLSFTGSDERLACDAAWSSGLAQPCTIIMVCDAQVAVPNRHMFGSDSNFFCYVDGTGMLHFAGVGYYDSAPTSPSVVVWEFDGASSKTYLSSTTATATGDAGADGAGRLCIGNYAAANGYPINGKIAEVIAYDDLLSASDRSAVINYLGTKFNIPIS